MKQSIAQTVRALAVLLLFVPAPLAVAGTPAAYADTTAATVLAQPAVEIPAEAEAEEEAPWTMRFLAPLTIVLGVVTVGGALAYYVVRIRGRYRLAQ